jgi:concanavalin A-like lectin/glucanase superfamily protein
MAHLQHLQHLPHLSHVLGGAAASRSFAQLMAASAPLAWWRFEEASGNFLDATANAYDLAAVGTPTRSQAGAIRGAGQCIRCMGDAVDYASRADAAPLRLIGTDFTIQGWFRLATVGSQILMQKDQQWQISTTAGGKPLFAFPNVDLFTGGTGPDAFQVGRWHHVAVVRAGTAYTTFLDAVQQEQATTASSQNAVATTAQIGVKCDGWMDEVALHARAMSAAEILGLFNAGRKTMVEVLAFVADLIAFNGQFNPVPAPTHAQLAAIEVNAAGGGFIAPNGDPTLTDNATDGGFLSNFTYATPPVTGDAWRILSDVPALTFGPSSYLRVPSSGVLS